MHGAYHASRCWERLEAELRRRGHAATAVDLPCEDQDCATEDARWAASLLRRQGQLPITEVTPLAEWPTTPSVYVLCRDDRVVNPYWARTASRERLGVGAVELPGGHSPFLSRPADLAEMLAAEAVRQA